MPMHLFANDSGSLPLGRRSGNSRVFLICGQVCSEIISPEEEAVIIEKFSFHALYNACLLHFKNENPATIPRSQRSYFASKRHAKDRLSSTVYISQPSSHSSIPSHHEAGPSPFVPLTSMSTTGSTPASKSTMRAGFGVVTGCTFNFRIARLIPSNVVRSLISIVLARSLMAFRPIFSWRSCHPASSPATTCCVYRSSLPNSSASSFVLLTFSSFSSFSRCRVSSSKPRGQRVERDNEL
jgi:hypothetical protein